jgi:hypothetical protein
VQDTFWVTVRGTGINEVICLAKQTKTSNCPGCPISYQNGNDMTVKLLNGQRKTVTLNPLNAKFNPIWHLLALFGAQHILHVSRIRVNYEISTAWKTRQRMTPEIDNGTETGHKA